MSARSRRIIVVGASLAGAHAVHTLRREGFDGEILLIGAEVHAPYDRPPLSKGSLTESRAFDGLGLRFLRNCEFDPRFGVQVRSLDATARTIELAGGERLAFDGLVIATGSSPVRLDPERFPAVTYLRTVEDAAALAGWLRAATGPLVILGAGLIGCEVAATARGLGVEVVLVDPLLPCERAIGPRAGEVLRQMHAEQGVAMCLAETAVCAEPDGRLISVRTSGGRELEAGAVLAAIGARPETRWLEGSGLTLDDGVVCDGECLAAPGIVAAGDVARWRHPRGLARLEHWNNAVEQGRHAARSLLAELDGRPAEPYLPVPWFWSDQYGHKIQVAGWVTPDCELEIVEGDPAELRFFAEYRSGDGVVAAIGVDAAKSFNAWLAEPGRATAGMR
ncbi:FAD-dependent oxidoreductase [Amycolatopsis sp. K13G38]|uniref:FAD-dependent oxidoreductase n=1 Tax=Amycolatopsis acididurans TaxID=2724524 RepID=A0ABX1J8P6_9PSEU|nr:FAD-dependent oxidoreductase [Amycolatopsis acididurans]NKQ56143.1 FAD-dependent oxidoreductase [Amycolatopsis acididurans]